MRFLKMIGVKTVALAVAFAMAPAAVPSHVPLVGASEAKADPYFGRRYVGSRHYRGGRSFRGGRYYRGGRYRGGRHYSRRRGNSSGAAIAGAIIGLGIGAAIASQPRYYRPAPRYYRVAPSYGSNSWYSYCASKYRSFDPRSGTYQPYNGPRRVCR